MVLGVISSDGRVMETHFFNPGENVTAAVYLDVLRRVVKPWVGAHYQGKLVTWQQDSAPAHKAKTVQRFCKEGFSSFWSTEEWSPNSPDLNPLDFFFWGYVEAKACAVPHSSVTSLKAAIAQVFATVPKTSVIRTCQSFRRRLERVIEADGGHIE